MWGKEPNSEATEWMGSLQGWAQGTPHLRGLLGDQSAAAGGPVLCGTLPNLLL